MSLSSKTNQNSKEVSYSVSFLIVAIVISFGIITQVVFGNLHLEKLIFPRNIVVLFLIISLIIIGNWKFRGSSIVSWLSSTKAAISSIVGFTVVTLIMGLLTQGTSTNTFISKLGLNTIASSWIYAFSLLLLLFSLGFATIKRLYPLKKSNFWFILNHLGLWVTIVAANFGSIDQTHLRISVSTAKYANIAFGEKGEMNILPFSLKQKEFSLETYNPRITIMDSTTTMISVKSGKNTLEAKSNNSIILKNWNIKVLQYLPSAELTGTKIVAFDSIGTAPAAYVSARNVQTNKQLTGWLSCGGNLITKMYLSLDSEHMLVMLPPADKEYKVLLYINNGKHTFSKQISINNPYTYLGWQMYIVDFNRDKAKWSDSTIIELVNDPWQPVVYMGLFMMIVGSLFVFWRGKK